MMKRLGNWFSNRYAAKAGSSTPAVRTAINQYYSEKDPVNRWQGDVYHFSSFAAGSLPTDEIPYWILANRTCHLVEEGGRTVKPPQLTFFAARKLCDVIEVGTKTKTTKNQIKYFIKECESTLFLPAYPEQRIEEPLVGMFDLIYSASLNKCPKASDKALQLSSPFAEHAFQKFANYFYTVGFDDRAIKTEEYFDSLTKEVEASKAAKP
ncbi:MAG: hypothetical protein AB7F59_15025 [Bdellovibrionales bacterium]